MSVSNGRRNKTARSRGSGILRKDASEIVGLDVGSRRSRKAAKRLWLSLPAVYRQCAVAYTDLGQA